MHKLVLPEPLRYSEDIDLVQRAPGPIRPVLAAIQARLDPWLGPPGIEQRTDAWRMTYRFLAETGATRKVKVEINTREHGSHDGWREVAVALASPWYTGAAPVTTFSTSELLATKLRALYQRRKGRDLFDLAVVLGRLDVDEEAVVRLFRSYLNAQGLAVTRADFEANLAAKLRHPLFLADTGPLLRRDITHDAHSAAVTVRDRLLVRL